MSLSLAERLGIPTNRAKAAEGRQVSGSRKSPYVRISLRPSPPRDTESQWKHDKFAEVNDIAGGVLGARLFTGTTRPGSSATGKTRVAVDNARLLRALGEANASNGNEARPTATKSGSGLEIRGASTGTTIEVRELVPGTTSADVKEIFQQHGEILSHKEVKPLPQGHTPDSVTVRLKFATQKSAEAVVAAYNGQKADGRVLSVKICDAPLVQGTATLLSLGGKIDKSVDILAQPETGSKMYSDALVNDPGAIVLTAPSGPAGRGRGGRRGRGRGRGARGSGMDVD
ncbi:RNA recognition motif domain-containing protein [Rhizoctonia solani AG-1 IA]|uniref:RNA recognition motif domain-containing protein n=1 Tax=Thanatephorus cucumeris (strain AG1-IA) TaxID=983506 RepID=L8WVT2_THACA|nr:RNA recognition motif domain-containing protein [Rhizoctonia solani AG-1 IA]